MKKNQSISNKLITDERALEKTNKLIKSSKRQLKLYSMLFGVSVGALISDLMLLASNEDDSKFYGILSVLFVIVAIESHVLVCDQKKSLKELMGINKYEEEFYYNSIETLNDVAFSNTRKPIK